MKKYRVAFIGAHPDDIERNAGGTVAILSQAGWEVELVSLTSGQKGSQGNPETRMSEFHEAAKMFGVKTVILDFEDTELIDDLASRLSLVAYLRRFRPHLVLMPYPERGAGCIYGNHGHPDHAVTGQITLNALPLANFSKVLPDLPPWHTELALYYLLPLGVVPDVFVPISQPMMDMALAAVDCHISQQGLYRGYGALHQYLIAQRLQATRMGVRLPAGCLLAEAFCLSSPIVAGSKVTQAFLVSVRQEE